MQLDAIPDLLAAPRHGELEVCSDAETDSEDRLPMIDELIHAADIAFMVAQARGLIC